MARGHWITALTSLALVGQPGCDTDDCPVGQVRYDGECVDVIPTDTTPQCGPGTYLHGGVCWADPAAVCGANTEVVYVTDASGVETREFFCEGQQVTDVPPCPASPDGQLICVSGRARFLMDPANPCNLLQTAITFGADATALEVAIYNPMAYAGDPTTPPLGVAEVNPQTGTWKVENIEVPSQGFIAVTLRSKAPATGFVLTGYPYAATAGFNLEEVAAYGITADQNTAWSAALGDAALAAAVNCNAGDTLWDCGTWVGVFGYVPDDGALHPLEGIVPRNGSAAPLPALPLSNTFYLDDTCEGFVQPATLAASYTTGTGVVFMPGATLSTFGGTCADLTPDSECETGGYTFAPGTGGAAPQAIFVQLQVPEGLE